MEAFQETLEQQYRAVEKQDSLQGVRAKAWDHFLELGLPSRHMETYQYIKLSKLFSNEFTFSSPTVPEIEPHILPECQNSLLVFVNGHFQSDLSRTKAIPDRVVITTLEEASKTYSALLNNHWAKSLKQETDPFAAVNAALHRDGAFLYVPPKTVVETPIQILHLIDTDKSPMMMLPRLHLFVGAQSQLEMVSTVVTESGEGWCWNGMTEIAIEEDAHVHLTQVAWDEPENSWHFDAVRATLKRNSTLKTVAVTNGSATVRNDYHVILTGENSEGMLNGVWNLQGKREAHSHVLMEHQAPNCRSMQLFKGVLNDTSRSSFEGKIYVHQAAQKTDAFQLNQNLLLSEGANADSKPNLEIFADDVKASHGATVGQLDAEQILYMKTRGISEATAKGLLVRGYCNEVLEMIRVPSLRNKLTRER